MSDGIGLSEETLPAESVELPDPSLLSFSGSEVDEEVTTPSVTWIKLSPSGCVDELEAEEVVSKETAGASVPSLLASNGVVLISSWPIVGATVAATLDELISSVLSSVAVDDVDPSETPTLDEPISSVVVESAGTVELPGAADGPLSVADDKVVTSTSAPGTRIKGGKVGLGMVPHS
jgi:hypothetical protein